ncbi:lipoyl(octanoyl) transferase LipB [bacterium]|nr:lipoyl(octanoyl) transferase LipB [bacterium]
MVNGSDKRWLCCSLSLIDYKEAWELQTGLVEARKTGGIETDVVLFAEHPPVFTLGRRGGSDNLKVQEDFLRDRGIPVFRIERGGSITYHGPGQIVVYPIVDLNAARLSVKDYIGMLEEVMIRTSSGFGVDAQRNPLNRGIWVGPSKLGSVGIAIRKGISFHGIALNVNLSMEPFEWINPCGLKGVGVTSMEKALSNKISINSVCEAVKTHIESVFGIVLEDAAESELQNLAKMQNVL